MYSPHTACEYTSAPFDAIALFDLNPNADCLASICSASHAKASAFTALSSIADDHANAKYLAEGIARIPGLQVNMKTVETNMVYIDHTPSGLTTDETLDRLKDAGVIASARPPRHVRIVTNRHHDRAIIEKALERIRHAMEGR